MARTAALLALIALTLSSPHVPAADRARPNVLFIAVDDLNHWVGYTGRNPQTRTPNIDKLAARGVAFTRAYCAAPICNPSRAAILSGLRPSTTGVYENPQDWRKGPGGRSERTLPSVLQKNGYYTAGAGKIYHGGFFKSEEWDDYLERPGGDPKPTGDTGVGGIKFAPLDCRDDELADYRITTWIIDKLQQAHKKPFFLACGLHKPHMPWNVPRKYFELFPLETIQLPPTRKDDLEDVPPAGLKVAKVNGDHAAILRSRRWKEAVQGYLAAIAYTDMNIGRLLEALDASVYKTNTVIVFWGDHGWHLGEKEHWRKFALWEEATRAPLIWVVPGVTPKGAICERTVDFMHIYPTLTDFCGVRTPKHVQGKSIRPLLADPKAAWETPALTTYRFNEHAVRNERWRFILYADGAEELYDHQHDPYEWTNVASKVEFESIKKQLSAQLPAENAPPLGDSRKPARARRTPAKVPAPPTQN